MRYACSLLHLLQIVYLLNRLSRVGEKKNGKWRIIKTISVLLKKKISPYTFLFRYAHCAIDISIPVYTLFEYVISISRFLCTSDAKIPIVFFSRFQASRITREEKRSRHTRRFRGRVPPQLGKDR